MQRLTESSVQYTSCHAKLACAALGPEKWSWLHAGHLPLVSLCKYELKRLSRARIPMHPVHPVAPNHPPCFLQVEEFAVGLKWVTDGASILEAITNS